MILFGRHRLDGIIQRCLGLRTSGLLQPEWWFVCWGPAVSLRTVFQKIPFKDVEVVVGLKKSRS